MSAYLQLMNAQHVRNKNSTVCVYTENRTVLEPCQHGSYNRAVLARFARLRHGSILFTSE